MHQPSTRVEPLVPAADSFQEAPKATAQSMPATEDWWRLFQDPGLDALVEQALISNLDLAGLAARIEQAEALLRQAGARLYPSVDASGGWDSRWVENGDDRGNGRGDSVSAGGFLNWELDFWGKLRSAKSARRHEAEAAVQDWQAGRLFLSAAVAEIYFEIWEQRQQLRLAEEQIAVNQTLLDLTQLRFGQGQSSIVDVLQQRVQLAATRSRVPDLEARLEQLEYALDVLLSLPPGGRARQVEFQSGPLPELPAAGMPSEVLAQRPDLVAAQNRIIALDYRVGEAIAERLPRFVLGGSLIGAGDPGFHSLVASAFGSAAGPLFDAGSRRAEVRLRRARLREALADYSAGFLAAVQEVEGAYVRDRKQSERVSLLQDQLQTAQDLLRESRNRYRQGLTDYLPVLTAVVTEQNLQRELLTSRRELLSFRVALHRALGGPMKEPGESNRTP